MESDAGQGSVATRRKWEYRRDRADNVGVRKAAD